MQIPTHYHQKLSDIQQALTLVDTDKVLIFTICNEMAFQWVPEILDQLVFFFDQNRQLQEENHELNLQNDSLLKQNIGLSQRLNRQ